jgi:hypothetical protein
MHVEIEVDRPLDKIMNDREFLEETVIKKFSGFLEVGQQIYGIRRREVGTQIIDPKKGKMAIVDLSPTGTIVREHTSNNFHVIAGGTPHHTQHSYGYWHINDMDELNLKIPGRLGELGYSFIIMQKPVGSQGESFAWYCRDCYTILYELRAKTGRYGLTEFWRLESEAVRGYNSDVKHRTCPECGLVNYHGYHWNQSKDRPEEAEARSAW